MGQVHIGEATHGIIHEIIGDILPIEGHAAVHRACDGKISVRVILHLRDVVGR